MKKAAAIIFLSYSIIFLSSFEENTALSSYAAGTLENPVIDSNMTYEQALDGISVLCPPYIKDRQRLISVKYLSFDNKIHQGQLVIDKDLTDDIEFAFKEALNANFPIHSVIPISHNAFRKNGQWDDNLSMEANNSSGFNYRTIMGTRNLSMHAGGRAVDINPVQNPYITRVITLPVNSSYNPEAAGALTKDSIIVKTLISRGWVWGGNWTALKDYQHFEK